MGVRQLETFIQKHVTNGYIDISLREECQEFKRQNDGMSPTLLIELQGLLNSMIKDKREWLCGIRHNIVYNNFNDLFIRLSQYAELIFFVDGIRSDNKKSTRQKDKYKKSKILLEKINEGCSVEELIQFEDLFQEISHLDIAKIVAEEHGSLKIAMDRECDAEMAQFACKNPSVLAIMSDDSDFLIYPGSYKYFSLKDLNQDTLNTKEYNRIALRETLNLNDMEMVILSTLNGNDVISFDKDTFYFHKSLNIGNRYDPYERVSAIAKWIKDKKLFKSKNIHSEIANTIFRNNNDSNVKKIKESIELYNINFKPQQINYEDQTLEFCKENSFNYVIKILNEKLVKISLIYFDHSRSVNCFESVINLFRKQIGIILRDKPIMNYKILSKMLHIDSEYSEFKVNKITPTCVIPPLIELLDRLKYPEHDATRFDLLKWLISKDKLLNVNLESTPTNIFIDILTLTFMVHEGFIDVIEADIILLSIKHVENDLVPEDLKAPEILTPRAFFISFMFSNCIIHVTNCMKTVGLKELIKTHNFDGMLFHNLYKEHSNQSQLNTALLDDYMKFRYYA